MDKMVLKKKAGAKIPDILVESITDNYHIYKSYHPVMKVFCMIMTSVSLQEVKDCLIFCSNEWFCVIQTSKYEGKFIFPGSPEI